MAEERVPRGWIGKEVGVTLLTSAGYDPDTLIRRPVAAANMTGPLEDVTDHGIVGRFADDVMDAALGLRKTTRASAFYPWSAVLSVSPIGDEDEDSGVALLDERRLR